MTDIRETWRSLDRAIIDNRRLVAALRAVLDLHRQDPYDGAWCVCEELWPCSTTVAITGALGGDA